ncbi:choice-of-anchor J family PEP-CTERM protein [Paludibaculum fermentans]|uniref:PEP-CTERM sorting domain-containing protein n=1 Tax=Paludibaculum fermentans TaxID=1473598 RepID=A0A7S7NSK2_PALFE|nr:choice-of-anchor J domain-containing protein [Paludibaculum fermentans]QOY88931.1 PEP-CTERM sorting domain-containing protein [Paludibaculum fermentans]
MRRSRALGLGLLLLAAGTQLSAATLISEGFTDVTTLAGDGWVVINNSAPIGTDSWFQGNTGVFNAQSGPADAYIAANFLSAAASGNVSNWLISPVITFSYSTGISFYTRTESPQLFADSLELRLSTNGASTDVGASDSSVGDFTTLILSVNPLLNQTGYPGSWTHVTAVLNPFVGTVSGRLALRYLVPDTSTNGNYIGVDTFKVEAVPEPATFGLMAAGFGAILLRRLRRQCK